MVSVTHTARNIDLAAGSLQEDLVRLQAQKQALERELAAVVAHLGSVQRALSALESLMLDPAAAAAAGIVGDANAEQDRASAPVEPQTDIAVSTATDVTAKAEAQVAGPKGREGAAHAVSGGASAAAGRQKKYGKLTDQIMEYVAAVGDADVRARDVAAALGRDSDSGSINAVRSTLDRLVGASRVQRTGRGLYRAKRS
ncbi:hypothetical protein [Streptomyces sp. NBC_01217]|uniref:hypothetical protein n=1 Tax=Streptomyces sp. NBC_01217 TaxID=2903779 RepID=UPI002E108A0F|nr:hypothetical protein OG507_34550 [Streptomyces sp. NBC_01217]